MTQFVSVIDPEIEKESIEYSREVLSDVRKEDKPLRCGTMTRRSKNSSVASDAESISPSVNKNTMTSRSSIKPSSQSSVRKSSSSSTTLNVRQTKSSHSSVGSGDEDRKALASVTGKDSLSIISQGATVKLETLAEKRGISVGNSHKPTTSANSTYTKPILRSNSTATRLNSGSKATIIPNTKPSASGSLSNGKKKISTISASASTMKPQSRNSAISSKEFEGLKVKLESSTAQVDEQKNQLRIAEEKIDELRKQLSEETNQLAILERNHKIELDEIIKTLKTKSKTESHEQEIEIHKAQSPKVNVHERSTDTNKEHQQNRATEILTINQNLIRENELIITSLDTELAAARAEIISITSKLSEKDIDILSLNSQIESDNRQKETMEQEYQSRITDLQKSLIEEKEAAISAVKIEFEDRIMKIMDEMKSVKEEKADIMKKFAEEISDLQVSLEKSKASLTEEKIKYQQIFENNSNEWLEKKKSLQTEIDLLKIEVEKKSTSLVESALNLNELNAKYDSSQREKKDILENMSVLEAKLNDLEIQHSTDFQELCVLRDDLSQVKAELNTRRQMMDVFSENEKIMDEVCSKVKTELEATNKKLDEKNREISQLREDHLENLNKISELHNIKTTVSKENHVRIEEQIKYYENLLAEKSKELHQTKQDHKEALKLLENKILVLEEEKISSKSTNETIIDNTKGTTYLEPTVAYSKELQDFKDSKEGFISNLSHNYGRNLSDDVPAIEESQADNASMREQLETLRKELQDLHDQQSHISIVENEEYIANKTIFQMREELAKKDAESEDKYKELENKMMELLNEANEKAVVANSRLEEAENKLKLQKVDNFEAKIISRRSEMTSSNSVIEDTNRIFETENEQNDSSAALASVSKLAHASVVAQQLLELNDNLQNPSIKSVRPLSKLPPELIFQDHEKSSNTITVD